MLPLWVEPTRVGPCGIHSTRATPNRTSSDWICSERTTFHWASIVLIGIISVRACGLMGCHMVRGHLMVTHLMVSLLVIGLLVLGFVRCSCEDNELLLVGLV